MSCSVASAPCNSMSPPNVSLVGMVIQPVNLADFIKSGGDIQTAINNYSVIYVPSGTFLAPTETILIPSHRLIYGTGTIVLNQALSIDSTGLGIDYVGMRNADATNGNSNIIISGVTISAVNHNDTDTHCCQFINSNNIQFINNTTEYGADGISFVSCSNYNVQGNKGLNHNNAAIDQWAGSSDGYILDNIINANNIGSSFGILVTGYTGSGPATTENIVVSNNTVINVGQAGIWLQGGYDRQNNTTGLIENCRVQGNIINGVKYYHGIYLTDCDSCTVEDNIIENIAQYAIYVGTEYNGYCSKCIIENNKLQNIGNSGLIYLDPRSLPYNNIIKGV